MNTLLYKSPAFSLENALPVGNGRLGALVMGGISSETIYLNEESVWSTNFIDRNNKACAQDLKKIQALLSEGNTDEASQLIKESMTGTPAECAAYRNACAIHLDFFTSASHTKIEEPSGYARKLELDTGIASVSFSAENSAPSTALFARNASGSSITYTREVVASSVDDVIAIHVSGLLPKSLYFRVYFEHGNLITSQFSLDDDTITIQDTHGIPMCAMATVNCSGGKCYTKGNCIIVEGGDDATIYVDMETAYRKRHYRKRGGKVSRSAQSLATWCTDKALKKLCFAAAKPYQSFVDDHIAYYARKYNRTSLTLSDDKRSVPELFEDNQSPALAELFWNYTRYLMLCSCRAPGTLPVLECGLWNFTKQIPSLSYAEKSISDIYEKSLSCSMEEAVRILIKHMGIMYKKGRKTARIMYQQDGWVCHDSSDIWGDCAPCGIKSADSLWILGAAKLACFIKDYYDYTLDQKYLKKNFYLLREACTFVMGAYSLSQIKDNHELLKKALSTSEMKILQKLFASVIASAKVLCITERFSDFVLYSEIFKTLSSLLESDKNEADSSKSYSIKADDFCTAQMGRMCRTMYDMTSSLVKAEISNDLVKIDILHCLPDQWQTGSIKGVHLPGNLRADVEWENGKIKGGRIWAKKNSDYMKHIEITYDGKKYPTELQTPSLDILNVLPSTIWPE